jgi:hypothetical protein
MVNPKIKIKRRHLRLDPSIDVFSVSISDKKGVWLETVPTEETLHWFLRGIKAGAECFGNEFIIPSISKG